MQVKKKLIIAGWVIALSVMLLLGRPNGLWAADPIKDWYGVVEGDIDRTYLVVGIYPDGDAAYDALLNHCSSPWIYTIFNPLDWRWDGYNGVICAYGEEHVYSSDGKWQYALLYLHPIDGILPDQTEPVLDLKSRGN